MLKGRIARLSILGPVLAAGLLLASTAFVQAESEAIYVGSETCRDCHETEYNSFKANCKKTQSYKNVLVMKKGLTEEEFKGCLECHTTGFGKPGGFVSEEETPHLMEAGCEVCHGPGSRHVESEDAGDIRSELTPDTCEACHNAERIEAFNYKPLIFGGAH